MNPPLLFVHSFLLYLGCAGAAGLFLKVHFSASKAKQLLFPAALSVSLQAISAASLYMNIPYMAQAIAVHLTLLGLIMIFYQENTGKKVLAAAILTTTIELAGNFSESFFSFLLLLFLHTVKQEAVISIWGGILISWIKLATVAAALFLLSKRLTTVFEHMTGLWQLLLAIPLFFLNTIMDLINFGATLGILFQGGAAWKLYYNQLFSHGAICIFTALSLCSALFYIFGMERIFTEQRKKEWYRSQLSYYKMLEEQYSCMERLRHDMKNHVISLQSLLEQKEWEKLEGYLKQMTKAGGLETGGHTSGNKVVDVLLYQKEKQAMEHQIRWDCNVQLPESCPVEEFDLCVLFGNLLDNSLNACRSFRGGKSPFIQIHAKTVKQFLLLEIKNSTDRKSTEAIRPHRRIYPEKHGIGLLNVTDVIHKYNGALTVEPAEQVFTVSILLPLCPPEHDI